MELVSSSLRCSSGIYAIYASLCCCIEKYMVLLNTISLFLSPSLTFRLFPVRSCCASVYSIFAWRHTKGGASSPAAPAIGTAAIATTPRQGTSLAAASSTILTYSISNPPLVFEILDFAKPAKLNPPVSQQTLHRGMRHYWSR